MNEALCLELTGVEATEQFGAALARIFTNTQYFPHSHEMSREMSREMSSGISSGMSLGIPSGISSGVPSGVSSGMHFATSSSKDKTAILGTLSVLYLIGDLGTGKTSFARGFVEAMPCGDMADIASPSFALCNMYDTKPPVLHCDVYRTSGALTEDLETALDEGYPFVIVEWADLIPKIMLPPHRLEITFTGEGDKRFVQLQPFGDVACAICAQYALLTQ